jgi:hypothetical protein
MSVHNENRITSFCVQRPGITNWQRQFKTGRFSKAAGMSSVAQDNGSGATCYEKGDESFDEKKQKDAKILEKEDDTKCCAVV